MRIKIDAERHETHIDGKKVELSPTQFKILKILLEADGRVITRSQLMKEIWGIGPRTSARLQTRTVDQHIARIRERIRPKKPVIRTVVSKGYAIIRD